MLYQLSYLPRHSCTYVTITHGGRHVNGWPSPPYSRSGLRRPGDRTNRTLKKTLAAFPRGQILSLALQCGGTELPLREVEYASAVMDENSSNGKPRAAGLGDVLATSADLRLPLARLLQLLTVLQAERFPNVRRLAEACGVSRRTIYRDLTTLETAGLSIVYHPDRQGYRIGRECLLQPSQLDDREALAL